jgi:hypothetical protein
MAGVNALLSTRAATAALIALWLSKAAAQIQIEAVPGQSSFKLDYEKATDFSGITWVAADQFYAVSNRDRAIFPLRLTIAGTGLISRVHVGARIPVKTTLNDFEGIAYWPAGDRLYVSTERPAGIVGTDRLGDATFHITVPEVFNRARRNKSLESLAFGAGAFWTANEDAIERDGEPSSAGKGALIRLQKFDERLRPVAQFAYRSDTSLLRVSDSGTGVTDLAVLPNGRLLVLERVVGLGLIARIYLVDFEDAIDTTKIAAFGGSEVVPVKKTLLFERSTGRDNFEGIALGPELEDGWRSLILIADSGGGVHHILMPLRIRLDAGR